MIRATPPMRNALAKTYMVLALGCGAVMAFLNPPFQSPDEPNHFFRALTISEGRWIAMREHDLVGGPVRARIIQWVFALNDDLPGHPENKQSAAFLAAHTDVDWSDRTIAFADFRSTALYSPVVYLPQAAGLALGRWTGMPLLYSLYLARLLNLALCVALGYWACRQLPYGVLTLVLIALSPLFLFQQASLSADGPSFAITVAFTALVLRISSNPSAAPLSSREIAGLCALGALVGLTKPSAATVPLLALLLMQRPSSGPGDRPWRDAVLVMGVSWIALLGWTVAMSHLYVPAHPFIAVDPRAQLEHVLAHPGQFAATTCRTLALHWSFYYQSAVGMLGWLDTKLAPRYIDTFYVIVLLSGAVSEDPRRHATWRERVLAALLIAATYVLLALIMHLTWNRVGGTIVEGLQGRYFLSLAALWAAMLQWPVFLQARVPPRLRVGIETGCLAYAVFFLGHAFQALARRFWL